MGGKERLKQLIGFSRFGRIRNRRARREGYVAHQAEFDSLNPNLRHCFLIGTANYGNLGDLAISEAQLRFLEYQFDGEVIEIQTSAFWEYEKLLSQYLKKGDVLCFQGGGNMGDTYYWFEQERCAVMETFPSYRSIVLPQTISYSSDNSPLLRYTQKIYKNCTDLHLFAREQRSAQIMQRAYPTVDVNLIPDIVLSLDASPYIPSGITRKGLTMVLRNDKERSLSDADWSVLEECASETGLLVRTEDTVIDVDFVTIDERRVLLSEILTVFASSEVVITDRLHGMIFAAITNTPCVVLSNSNHKISGVYQWIKNLPYIQFIKNPEDAKDALIAVRAAHAEYPRAAILPYFDKLIELLK